MEELEQISEQLIEKDVNRLLREFEDTEVPEGAAIPSTLVVSLYEIMLRPALLDLPQMNTGAAFPTMMSVLCRWKPLTDVPQVNLTRMAFGILRLIGSTWVEVSQWAKAFSWHDFSDTRFAAHFDAMVRFWESLLLSGEQLETDFFYTPPNPPFFELMTFTLRRTSHLNTTGDLFKRYRLFTRIVGIALSKVMQTHRALEMLLAVLHKDQEQKIWVGEAKPLVRAIELVTELVEPGLDPKAVHNTSALSTAAQVAQGLVATASHEFSLDEYLILVNKICNALLASHESAKDHPMLRKSIKQIVQIGLERRPPLVPDISVKSLWVRFVDPKTDMKLIRAAQRAESQFLRHAILDELHDTAGVRQALFPQRMIVSSVLEGPSSFPLIIDALCHCCTLSLLDLNNPHDVLRDKHLNIAREVLTHLGNAMESTAKSADKAQWSSIMGESRVRSEHSASEFKVSAEQRKIVATVAVYWLSSAHVQASFHRFMAIAAFNLKRNGPEETVEASLFLQHPRQTAIGLRSILWDVQLLRFKACASSFPTLLDLVSRFMQTEWFRVAVSNAPFAMVGVGAPSLKSASNHIVDTDSQSDEEIASDILPLAWLLVRNMLTPSVTPITADSSTASKASTRGVMGASAPVEQRRTYVNVKAISGALRTLIVIFTHFSSSFIVQRAISSAPKWLPTFLRLPLWLKESKLLEDRGVDVVPMWKGASMSIRKQMLAQAVLLGEEINKVLESVIEWINPVEWTNLLSMPLKVAPPKVEAPSSPFANRNSITSTWENKQSKPVLNGSSLFTGGGAGANGFSSSPSTQQRQLPSSMASSHSKNTNSATTNKSMLPANLRQKILPSAPVEPTPPPGMTLQEKKEADAELARQAADRRKREANGAATALAEDAIVVKDTVAERTKKTAPSMNELHAKGRRMRLKSMDELYDRVTDLAFHNLNFPKDLLSGAGLIPNTFTTVDDYISTFEPLLLMELQAQLQTARDDMIPEATTKRILYKREYGASHEISVEKQNEWSSGSVFLMWPKSMKDPSADLKVLLADASNMPHCIGVATKDKNKQKKQHGQGPGAGLTLEGDDARLSIRVIVNQNTKDHRSGLHSKLSIGADWNFCSFFSLTTVLRQWTALQSIESLAHVHDLLRPSIGDNPNFMPHLSALNVRDVASKLNEQRKFNLSQRSAVESALRTRGFSFIQGPPGTGKTRTLVGLLSCVIALQGAPVLVCTPSNSAINEVIDRIMSFGLYDMTSSKSDAYIKEFTLVRVGNHPDMPERIKQISLKELTMRQGDKIRKDGFEKVQASILKGADIVCTTLSSSASHALIAANIPFKTVIIDEAAQAVELETLIPLQYRCEQCIMIGDPQQLPATVFAKNNFLYERSLFARFSETMIRERILLLNTQYRMHPDISLFPNRHFYNGKLIDGTVAEPSGWSGSLLLPTAGASSASSSSSAPASSKPLTQEARNVFSSLRFFDITQSANANTGARSMGNQDEVVFIISLVHKLLASNPKIIFDNKIVVITPYQLQRSMLKRAFGVQATSNSIFGMIEVATVDSYQGREKDIVIVSTVRATKGSSIGFLADVRRLNVALTRAKKSLWIVGKSSTLSVNPEWKALLDSLNERHMLTTVATKPDVWWSSL